MKVPLEKCNYDQGADDIREKRGRQLRPQFIPAQWIVISSGGSVATEGNARFQLYDGKDRGHREN